MKAMFTMLWLKDTAERVLKAFLQAVIAAWVLAPGFNYSAIHAVLFGGVVAGLTVLKSALGELVPGATPASWFATPHWVADAAERLLTTFLEAFLAAWLLNPGLDLNALKAAGLAGGAALLSLITSLLSIPVRSTLSPASMVKGRTEPRGRGRRARPVHGNHPDLA